MPCPNSTRAELRRRRSAALTEEIPGDEWSPAQSWVASRFYWLNAECPVWMAPALQVGSRCFGALGRVQSCLRPLCAVDVTAGPDGVRE